MGFIRTADGQMIATGADASRAIREALIAGTSTLTPEGDNVKRRSRQLGRAVRIIMEKGEAWPVATLTVHHVNPARPCPDCDGRGLVQYLTDTEFYCQRCDGSGQIGAAL